jgi:hypothetical protein
MLRLATDEDFNNRIVRGLLRRQPDLDLVRIQDAGLAGTDDDEVLAWAASEGRILITHDVTTMKQTAYDMIAGGLANAGSLRNKPRCFSRQGLGGNPLSCLLQ